MKKYLVIALGLAFAMLAVDALIQAKPTSKAPIYDTIKEFSPYYIEKRFGGLQIMSHVNPEFKEKPNNMDVFHRFESLEKTWGKKYLKIDKQTLLIQDKSGKVIKKLPLKGSEDTLFIHSYYGI
jgi:hypothetical protein